MRDKLLQYNPRIEPFVDFILQNAKNFGITNNERMAHFIAQIDHESGGFKATEENLNYRAETLVRVWPHRFPKLSIARQYEKNPSKLANFVYSNRMGNGSVESGDGFRYRGRGLIQLTGRDNYRAFSLGVFRDNRIENNPDLVAKPEMAVISALWYWNSRNLNELADKNDVLAITKKINGGTIGLNDRATKTLKARQIFNS